jgi:hypothetical protein
MARQMLRLSSAAVRNAKPGWHADGGGLYLQVTAGKKDGQINKSWVFCYARNKRGREMGLGSLNTIGLSQAREEAGRWRGVLKEGRDPIEVRDAERAAQQQAAKPAPAAVSFERCSILYMAAHEAGWRNAKHRQQWNNTLATYLDDGEPSPGQGGLYPRAGPVHRTGTEPASWQSLNTRSSSNRCRRLRAAASSRSFAIFPAACRTARPPRRQ